MTETLDYAQEEPVYKQAGFGHRFGAYLIDVILLAVINFAVAFAFNGPGSFSDMFNQDPSAARDNILAQYSSPAAYIGMLIYFLYFALMEASDRRATLGKMALGLIAVDAEGKQMSNQVSYLRNAIRFLEANIGGILFALYVAFGVSGDLSPGQAMLSIPFGLIGWIGFLMALGSAKTTFHDRVSKTFVVFKDR
jgi:uncharacterized RDD family membrane protein YckC